MVAFLNANAPNEYNAKTIAANIGVKEGSLRKELSRLCNDEEIVRAQKGFYRAVITAETILREEYRNIRLHGVKIEAFCPNKDARPCGDRNNPHAYTYNRVFEGHRITITIHQKGLYEIFVGSTGNPMDFPAFSRVCSYLEGHLGVDVWHGGRSELVQLGLNIDVVGWRLDGVKSVKLQKFKNAWSQIYQKELELLRVETHITTRLKLSEAVGILHRLSTPPPVPPPPYPAIENNEGMYG